MCSSPIARAALCLALLALRPPGASGGDIRSLADCVAIALREHPALASADAGVRKARAGVAASTAPALPQIAASYAITREKRSLAQLIEGPTNEATEVAGTFTYQQGQFALNQLLFDFGRTLLARRAALADLDAASADRERVEQAVVLGVKRAYYDLIVANRMLAVAEESRRQSTLHLDSASNRFRAGLAPRFDVVRQELAVATAELEVRTAAGNVALARENLRDAMGLADAITFEPDDAVIATPRPPVDDDRALELAWERRPELRGLAARRRAQVARIDAIARTYLPLATGHGDYLFSGEKQPEQEGWSIGALIRMPIFDGGLTPARLSAARADLMAIEADEREARQGVLLEVRESLVELRRSEGNRSVSEKALTVAREALRIAENRYGAGVGDVLELTSSQVAMSLTSASHVRILADAQLAMARLEHATGGPLPGRDQREKAPDGEPPHVDVKRPASPASPAPSQ